MTASTPLGAGREFDVIRMLLARWGERARGIGDDAAVLDVPPGTQLVASTDAVVEGAHFRRDWLDAGLLAPRELGWRATAAALSDLAAMAAEPLGILVALVVPDAWHRRLALLADGIGDAAAAAGAPIVGGNLARGGELSITTTVLGAAARPLRRDGAQPGDTIFVTGALGGSAAALDALLAGRAPAPALRDRFVHPVPRIREAQWLADRGAHAAIDLSDGLVADLGHLSAASGLRIEIDLDRVPRVEGISPRDAAASGEEYELAVAAPAAIDTAAFHRAFGIPLTSIGRVVRGEAPGVEAVSQGVRVAPPAGHDHFSSR